MSGGYSDGDGVEFLRKAAEQGDAEAQNNLGVCYHTGNGVVKDATEAVKWYRKSAEQGDANTQYNLGLCYDFGEGVAQDDVIAYKWFNLAAASGYEDAKRNREILEKRMGNGWRVAYLWIGAVVAAVVAAVWLLVDWLFGLS